MAAKSWAETAARVRTVTPVRGLKPLPGQMELGLDSLSLNHVGRRRRILRAELARKCEDRVARMESGSKWDDLW